MKMRSVARVVGAVGASALLMIGAATPAHAVTDVTHHHVDGVAINSSGAIGSKIGSSFYHWSGGTPAFDHRFVYDNPLAHGASCSGGVITIADGTADYNFMPWIGFDNRTTTEYRIGMTKMSGSAGTGHVTVNTTATGTIRTSTGTTETLGSLGHEHGTWTFNVGTCASGQTHTFSLRWNVRNNSTLVTTDKTIDYLFYT